MRIFFISVIKIYQIFCSCIFISSCRFYPSCSNYAILAIKKYGCVKGIYFSLSRIIRCHPFCKGGVDHLK